MLRLSLAFGAFSPYKPHLAFSTVFSIIWYPSGHVFLGYTLYERKSNMNPYVQTEDELKGMGEEPLIAHIRWLYGYIEEIKKELRDARIKV